MRITTFDSCVLLAKQRAERFQVGFMHFFKDCPVVDTHHCIVHTSAVQDGFSQAHVQGTAFVPVETSCTNLHEVQFWREPKEM